MPEPRERRFKFTRTYRCFACNWVMVFCYGNNWSQMTKFGVTGGFSVVPVFGFTEDLAHMFSAAIKPVGISSTGVSWKQNTSLRGGFSLGKHISESGPFLCAALHRTLAQWVFRHSLLHWILHMYISVRVYVCICVYHLFFSVDIGHILLPFSRI